MRNKQPDQLALVAGWCAYTSGVIAFFGIVFLVLMFIGFLTDNIRLQQFGTLNDICIIIQYLLALPIMLVLYQRLKSNGLALCRAATLIGIAGIVAVAVLQWLLVSGVLTFEEQVGLATAALLVVGIWLVMMGYLGRSTGNTRHSLLISILAAFYVGYPIWAIWLGRLLLSGNLNGAENSPSMRGEHA